MLLSVIIPVYNCCEYLLVGFEQLKKLYSLNIAFEIIYVNDGSTDESLQILKKIESHNANIKVISQENKGSSGARNTAIDIAKGKYIQFLDSDDYLDIENMVTLLHQALELDLDAISYRLDYVDEKGTVLGERSRQNVTHDKIISGQKALVEGFNPSSICVFLFKTEFLNNNSLRIMPKITHMDVEFTSRMMLLAKKIMFVDKIIYHYLQRQGSITKPTAQEKLKTLLTDEIIVASSVKNTLVKYGVKDQDTIVAIQKNYNSIVWNLLLRFLTKPKETDFEFKKQCLATLKAQKLYPIKGPLKTSFQKKMRYVFNSEILFKLLLKIKN